MEPRPGESSVGYCSRLRTKGEWGSAAEIWALAQVLKRSIQVYTYSSDGKQKFEQIANYSYGAYENDDKQQAVKPPIPIIYINNNHYQALLLVEVGEGEEEEEPFKTTTSRL